ncbi:hypothetical protein GCK72_019793 [Caenorhabditis remanei]|uniref:Peptidase C1A papain C-terminal domain-containing protein n=1 Tax=Caenorhabditis remanei TaxID=31234 RepID=A0A6A5GDB0_CAERE|nr:hypothetical protein GCK72_019793 [Caenorhabditis remanei]KAF1753237.1 hypothetical protein GCK72_019793 [Caenorhabditis remanei]
MDSRYANPSLDEDDSYVLRNQRILPSIPTTFDARTNWPKCNSIKMVRDQSNCGSCWAFGAAEVISDRICIHSNGKEQPVISAEDILTCCGKSCGNGCQGGQGLEAMKFWTTYGAVTGGDYKGDGCKPYSFAPCSNCVESKTTPSCQSKCQSTYTVTNYKGDKHYGTSAYRLDTSSNAVPIIQNEIYQNGPVEVAYTVYDDFYHYKSGVYHHVTGKDTGGHAVKIIGWGTEKGVDYWLVTNSWGTSFGDKGFFKIRRGTNECGIESNVVAGMAKVGNGSGENSFGFVAGLMMLIVYYFV